MSRIFTLDDQKNGVDYAIMLFKHFIHDGERTPSNITEVQIKDTPLQIKSEDISEIEEESNFYNDPSLVFNKTYENWEVNLGHVKLDGGRFPFAKNKDINLQDLLKKENLSPLMRLLTKLWIINQVKTHYQEWELNPTFFHDKENIESILDNMCADILLKIEALAKYTPSERNTTNTEEQENRFGFSAFKYKLAQRLSYLRMFVGHVQSDIHQITDTKLSLASQISFYVQTHLNIVLWRFLFSQIKNGFKESYHCIREFSAGKSAIRSLLRGFSQLLKSSYLTLWLPFLAAYFSVIGLTSIPTVLARRALKIRFAGKFDFAFTVFEMVKDLAITAAAIFISYQLAGAVRKCLLGIVSVRRWLIFHLYPPHNNSQSSFARTLTL